ncbi:MAG: protein kinase domain-containing protein [Myxococcota bacterium]
MTSPCPSDSELSAFVDGALTDAEAADVRAHLSSCETCLAVLRVMEPAESQPLWDRARQSRWSVGQQVGRYVLLSFVGAGAMGEVWAAWDPQLERRVALKRLAPLLSVTSGGDEVLAEARALARFHHPNVVTVYEVLEADRCLVMAFVEGETMRALQAGRGPIEPRLERWLEVARALSAAHAAGLVHRDVKPENVIVEKGHARLMDFGLASLGADDDGPRGTPAYMAPEARSATRAGPEVDQYAWALCVAECWAGRRGSAAEVLPLVPRSHRPVLARALEVEPARRWPSMEALLDAWARATRRSRRAAQVFLGLALLVTAAAGLVAMRRPEACSGGPTAMAEVWNDARRARLEARLSGNGHEPVYVSAVVSTLEALAREWVAQHRAACEATRVRGEQSEALLDARMACLERRRATWRAHLDTLEQADGPTTAQALEATERLPSALECGDVSALQRITRAPTQVSSALRERAQQQLAEAWSAEGLSQTARLAQTLTQLDETLDAGARADACLQAEASLVRARSESNEGRLEQAAARFEAAWVSSLECGDERLQQRTLVSHARLMDGRDNYRQELSWLKASEALLSRLEVPARVRYEQQLALAEVALARADSEQAEVALRPVLDDLAAKDDLSFLEAHVLWARAVLRREPGSAARAIDIVNQGLVGAEARLGREHPGRADLLQVRQSAHHERGELLAALRDAEEVLRLRTVVYGADSAWTATAAYAVSFIRAELAWDDDAVRWARDSLARVRGKPPRTREATRELHLGEVLVGSGRREEAAPLIESGFGVIAAQGEAANARLPAAMEALVRLRLAEGRAVEAVPLALRMVSLGAALWPKGTASQWRRETLLADALAAAGRVDEADGRYLELANRFRAAGLGAWAFEALAHRARARAAAKRWPVAEDVAAVEALRAPGRAEAVWCAALEAEAAARRRQVAPHRACAPPGGSMPR